MCNQIKPEVGLRWMWGLLDIAVAISLAAVIGCSPVDEQGETGIPGPGSLDTSFGSGGVVTTAVGSEGPGPCDLEIQADGKIVVAGVAEDGAEYDFAIVRYTSNGSLDTSFGSGGVVTTDISSDDWFRGMAIQADGKIVVAGRSNGHFALVRYSSDGSLDAGFGSGGMASTPVGANSDAYGVTIQANGKIVVVGSSYSLSGSKNDVALVRYNEDGSLDTDFGLGGKVTTPVGASHDIGKGIAIQDDGKLIVAGDFYVSPDLNYDYFVMRYNGDGSLDAGFGNGGIATTAVGSSRDDVYEMAVQADGKIVVVGFTMVDPASGACRGALVRYCDDGSLDGDFGSGGVLTVNSLTSANAVAIQADGKIITTGHATDIYVAALVRYNEDGLLDPAFGSGGAVIMDFCAGSGPIAIQSDKKIVVAGSANLVGSPLVVARYWP